jgi:porin
LDPAFVLPGLDDALRPWLDWRKGLADEHALQLGTDYQLLSQWASESLGEDHATGGAFRLFGDWTVLGENTDRPGSIVFKAEHRHAIGTEIAPEQLGAELGYVGIVGTGYGDFGLGVTDFFWKQQFLGKRPVELRLGRLAPTAYLDGTLTSDPYTTFLNFSLNYTPTVAYPADGSLGGALWVGITDRLYVLGTVLDANSDTTRSGFETIDESEFFSAIEFGWANRGAASSFVDNVHVTAWRSDERTAAGVPESEGIGLTGSWLFGDDRLGAVRATRLVGRWRGIT